MCRVAHRFGKTRGFCCTGPTGTGPVSDSLTRANTVPVTGYPRVSATGSHARRERCVCLAPPVTHFKGKSPLPLPSLTVDHPTPSRPRRLERAVSSLLSRDGPLETALAHVRVILCAHPPPRAVPQGPRRRRLEPPPLPASRCPPRTPPPPPPLPTPPPPAVPARPLPPPPRLRPRPARPPAPPSRPAPGRPRGGRPGPGPRLRRFEPP